MALINAGANVAAEDKDGLTGELIVYTPWAANYL